MEEGLADWVAYGEVVRKVGRLLRGLEEQGGFVSSEEDAMDVWGEEGEKGWRRSGGGSKVFALCEMLLEDLNNYAECMIPIGEYIFFFYLPYHIYICISLAVYCLLTHTDDSNTINLKLFPTRPPPPPIHAHQVPLLTISLSSLSTPISSDLTLTRILPFINGIHSVARIAHLADTDLSLTRKAIQHLVFYGCLILLDIFSFTAVYAPTAEIGGFITDAGVQEECVRYVRVPRLRRGGTTTTTREASVSSAAGRSDISIASSSTHSETSSHARNTDQDSDPDSDTHHSIPPESLITLYTSLRQGLPLRQWVLDNLPLLSGIDVRRFITFGVIKGFLYRVHKYAVATSAGTALPPAPPASLKSGAVSTVGEATGRHQGGTRRESVGALGGKGDAAVGVGSRLDSIVSGEEAYGVVRFLDGMHCFDEICTVVGVGEKVVEGRVRAAGEVQVFSR